MYSTCDVAAEKSAVVIDKTAVVTKNRNFKKGCGELCNDDKDCQAFQLKTLDEKAQTYECTHILSPPFKWDKTKGKCKDTDNKGIVDAAASEEACATKCREEVGCEAYNYYNPAANGKRCTLFKFKTEGDGIIAITSCFALTRYTPSNNTPIASTKDATEKIMCMPRKKSEIGKVIAPMADPVTKFSAAIDAKIKALKKDEKDGATAALWKKAVDDSYKTVKANVETWVNGDSYKAKKAAILAKLDSEFLDMWFMLISDTFDPEAKAFKEFVTNYKDKVSQADGSSKNMFGPTFGKFYLESSAEDQKKIDAEMAKLWYVGKSKLYIHKLTTMLANCSKTTLLSMSNASI